MKYLLIEENDLKLRFGITKSNRLQLFDIVTAGDNDFSEEMSEQPEEFSPVEAIVTGWNNPEDRLGHKLVHSSLGVKLTYLDMEKLSKKEGNEYIFHLTEKKSALFVDLHYQFYHGLNTFTCYTEVFNHGKEEQSLEAVSSFALHGFDRNGSGYDEKYRIHVVHNGWQKELQWSHYSLPELGLAESQKKGSYNSSKMVSFTNTGAWSTKDYLPLGIMENNEKNTYMAWQIEHNGSWHWEIAEHAGMLYFLAEGPTELYAQWYKVLKPGESFGSVPVSISYGRGNAEDAVREMTAYRRAIRRANQDDELLPTIYNDYMNCLWGQPTTEKELPLIDIAAKLGFEYYCIDCGWYSAGPWWETVGEWLPSEERFPKTAQCPNGLESLLSYIKSKGMIPGLWLELEVMGIKCPLAEQLPDDWFFMRHGKRVIEKSRYQLDFRNQEVRAFANSVVARLVEQYGVGYIKLDYNIEPGVGTDLYADSAGDGLLEHNRAYLSWIDEIFTKYPQLVIENCGSGGMRMDYALLKRYSIQSTSDMEDYLMYATISANAALALTPEQAAVWSYPLHVKDEEETIFNMVNVLLLRIHQSGHLFQLGEANQKLIEEAIFCYKRIREDRKEGIPVWPLGFATYHDTWVSFGLKGSKRMYIAIWKRGGEETECILSVPDLAGIEQVQVTTAYPVKRPIPCEWNAEGSIKVTMTKPVMARLLEIAW